MSQQIERRAAHLWRTAAFSAVAAAVLLLGHPTGAEAQQSASMTVSVMVQPSCRIQVQDAPDAAAPRVALNCSGQAKLARPIVTAELPARPPAPSLPEPAVPLAPREGQAGPDRAAASTGVVVNF